MTMNNWTAGRSKPFLRIPPFPLSRQHLLMVADGEGNTELTDQEIDNCVASIAKSQVGGNYWSARPELPGEPYVLVHIRDSKRRLEILETVGTARPIVVWLSSGSSEPSFSGGRITAVRGCCDPWHLIGGATAVYVDADDELALIAAIAGVAVRCVGQGQFKPVGVEPADKSALRNAFRHILGSFKCTDPFSGAQISFSEAINYCSFWKGLIDSNRSITAAIGFATWKKSTVAPMLWAGSADVPFVANARWSREDKVAIWKSRVSPGQLTELGSSGARLIEVEDGFIRSIGLGADCVPPLSIVVDPVGIYFDPGQVSGLETLLENGGFPLELTARAQRLRQLIVDSGISKYEIGGGKLPTRSAERRRLLVIGQVEDDRSVQCGGGAVQSNLELLRRVRNGNPNAFICYRPHPDVQAGHRVGFIPEAQLGGLADEVEECGPISQSLELADEVHVNTSLAGFEALLRGKPVTTYGVPFYAGWGLTQDLGDVPSRRTAKRSLDELVAAALLVYPRYLDPVTGLPCPAEILALRLAENRGQQAKGMLVRLRQMQGRWKRRLLELRLRVLK